jgi:hypothetical protein
MKSGPKGLGIRRSSGRCPDPSSSSWGAGSCMSRHRTWCGCAAGACMPTRKGKRWRGAGSRWARGQWRHPSDSMGRAMTRHGIRDMQSAVRCVGSGWCVLPSFPGPAPHHPQRPMGSRWHEGANGRGSAEANPAGTAVPGSGAFECSRAPRLPRRLPMVVPTAPRDGDWRREMERFQMRVTIHAPEGSISQPTIGARAVPPGVAADRGGLGGCRCRSVPRPLHASSFGG